MAFSCLCQPVRRDENLENLIFKPQPFLSFWYCPLPGLWRISKRGAGVYNHVFEILHGQEYICTSAVPPPFCPSDIFPVSSGKFTGQDDENIYLPGQNVKRVLYLWQNPNVPSCVKKDNAPPQGGSRKSGLRGRSSLACTAGECLSLLLLLLPFPIIFYYLYKELFI